MKEWRRRGKRKPEMNKERMQHQHNVRKDGRKNRRKKVESKY